MLTDKILQFIFNLEWHGKLPESIQVLNPYPKPEVKAACINFYRKYYAQEIPRILIMGINPGRLGAGLTGIPFTDPVHLESDCEIPNPFKKQKELTSDFIYKVISASGGAAKFYNQFYISAVCPLGFVQNGKNLNYYDVPEIKAMVAKQLPEWMEHQLNFGISKKICVCVGEGKNANFFKEMNHKFDWFRNVVTLPHPRFIMQYKRKNLDGYIRKYRDELKKAASLL